MLLLSAAVLFVVSPAVRAYPAHEAALQTVHETTSAPEALSAIDCTADDPAAPCGQFHLCCVTPTGLPTSDTALLFAPLPRTTAVSRSPADTGIVRDLTAPPPRS